jgi:purine-binding chemotaxis protein CheW
VEDNVMVSSHQYLTFILANEIYAIDVANIKEVLGVPRITRVPRMPEFMNGVINLRGSVVPVLDLRLKFSLGETNMTKDTGIIVTEIANIFDDNDSQTLTVGIFSDRVEKVIALDERQIEPPPKIGMAIDTSFIIGMGRMDDSFVIILDINRLLSQNELLNTYTSEAITNE